MIRGRITIGLMYLAMVTASLVCIGSAFRLMETGRGMDGLVEALWLGGILLFASAPVWLVLKTERRKTPMARQISGGWHSPPEYASCADCDAVLEDAQLTAGQPCWNCGCPSLAPDDEPAHAEGKDYDVVWSGTGLRVVWKK